MKVIRFLPLVFLMGMEGFNLFVPYLLFMAGLVVLIQFRRTRQRVLQHVATA